MSIRGQRDHAIGLPCGCSITCRDNRCRHVPKHVPIASLRPGIPRTRFFKASASSFNQRPQRGKHPGMVEAAVSIPARSITFLKNKYHRLNPGNRSPGCIPGETASDSSAVFQGLIASPGRRRLCLSKYGYCEVYSTLNPYRMCRRNNSEHRVLSRMPGEKGSLPAIAAA